MSRPRKQKIPKNIGPSSAFGTQSATGKRRPFLQKPPSKNHLFFVPERCTLESGTGKEHKPKLLSPDIFGGVGVFHVKGWGAKSSVCPSKPGKSNVLGGISRDFARTSQRSPKSSSKVCVQFLAPIETDGITAKLVRCGIESEARSRVNREVQTVN